MKSYFIAIFISVLLLLFTSSPVYAATCEITLDSIQANRIHACIGNFPSESSLGAAVISANFWSTNGQRLNEFIPDFTAAEQNGTYYTCFFADIPDTTNQNKTLTLQVTSTSGGSCSVSFNPTRDLGKIISSTNLPAQFNVCDVIKDNPTEMSQCTSCSSNDGLWTALGCIHFNPKAFITDFLKIAIGVAGGIALLLMASGAFMVATSMGNPKQADEGREIITGTIAGLLFIIFSVFLLRLIGVDILTIPGL